MNTKKLAKLALLLIFSIILIGGFSGGITCSAQKSETYYLLATHSGIPYWLDHKRGAKAAAEDLGVELKYVGAYGNKAEQQVNQLQQVIGKNPAGIMIGPVRPQSLTPLINKAVEQGIPVITVVTDAPKSKRLAYIGPSGYEAGKKAADYMADLLGSGEHYVGVSNLVGVYVCDQRKKGFVDRIKEEYPKIHYVGEVDDECDYEVGTKNNTDFLLSHPKIDGMLGTNAASAVGIATAIKNVGRAGEIKVVSWDNDSPTLKHIKEGNVDASVVHDSFMMSYMGIELLYKYNHDIIKLTQGSNWTQFLEKGLPNPWPTRIIFPAMFCTEDNVESFERQVEQED